MEDNRVQDIEEEIEKLKELINKFKGEKDIGKELQIIEDCRGLLNYIDYKFEVVYYDLLEEEDEQEN